MTTTTESPEKAIHRLVDEKKEKENAVLAGGSHESTLVPPKEGEKLKEGPSSGRNGHEEVVTPTLSTSSPPGSLVRTFHAPTEEEREQMPRLMPMPMPGQRPPSAPAAPGGDRGWKDESKWNSNGRRSKEWKEAPNPPGVKWEEGAGKEWKQVKNEGEVKKDWKEAPNPEIKWEAGKEKEWKQMKNEGGVKKEWKEAPKSEVRWEDGGKEWKQTKLQEVGKKDWKEAPNPEVKWEEGGKEWKQTKIQEEAPKPNVKLEEGKEWKEANFQKEVKKNSNEAHDRDWQGHQESSQDPGWRDGQKGHEWSSGKGDTSKDGSGWRLEGNAWRALTDARAKGVRSAWDAAPEPKKSSWKTWKDSSGRALEDRIRTQYDVKEGKGGSKWATTDSESEFGDSFGAWGRPPRGNRTRVINWIIKNMPDGKQTIVIL